MGPVLLRFALAIWFGGGLAVLFGTRAIFRVAQTRKQGGIFSGAVLSAFFGLRWAAVALTAIGWWFLRAWPTYWATAAAAVTIAHAPLDASIRRFRDQIGGSTEGLAPDDPRRKRWGALHAASVLLLLAQIACGAIGLF